MTEKKLKIVYWTCPESHHTRKEPELTSIYRNIKYYKCFQCNKSYSNSKWDVEIFKNVDSEQINLETLSYEELKKIGVKAI